jgi:hypothetical protein
MLPGGSTALFVSWVCCSLLSPFEKNDMYALTYPAGLNLGRQMGIQEAELRELSMDEACMVFRRMWMSGG